MKTHQIPQEWIDAAGVDIPTDLKIFEGGGDNGGPWPWPVYIVSTNWTAALRLTSLPGTTPKKAFDTWVSEQI